jgi:ribosomal protein S18 acetylase RimI-like enzyme
MQGTGENVQLRPYDGSLRDARGLIEVDAETFDQCSYTADELVVLLDGSGQWVAVVVDGLQVAGFVSCFQTQSVIGCRWEIDELAVRPAYQGRGLGTELVTAALARGGELGLAQARAAVAEKNVASRRVFEKVGFHAGSALDLLLYEVEGRVPRPPREGAVAVREAGPSDAAALAAHAGYPRTHVAQLIDRPDNVYLIAENEGRIVGSAELIEVQTLQYRGYWLESIAGPSGSGRLSWRDIPACKALANEAIEATKRRPALELVGRLASADTVEHRGCVSEGFRYIDTYHSYVCPVPG